MSVSRLNTKRPRRPGLLAVMILGAALVACTPTITHKIEPSPDPIKIDLNIQADVRVKLEEQAKEDIQANPNIF